MIVDIDTTICIFRLPCRSAYINFIVIKFDIFEILFPIACVSPRCIYECCISSMECHTIYSHARLYDGSNINQIGFATARNKNLSFPYIMLVVPIVCALCINLL